MTDDGLLHLSDGEVEAARFVMREAVVDWAMGLEDSRVALGDLVAHERIYGLVVLVGYPGDPIYPVGHEYRHRGLPAEEASWLLGFAIEIARQAQDRWDGHYVRGPESEAAILRNREAFRIAETVISAVFLVEAL